MRKKSPNPNAVLTTRIDRIIRIAGGINQLAALACVSRTAVYSWRARGEIPIRPMRRLIASGKFKSTDFL